MNQKEKEQEQKKLMFKLFSNGELKECMDNLQTNNDQLEPFQKEVDFKYLYGFDFKYLLGNYYQVYKSKDYYDNLKKNFKHKINDSIREAESENKIDSIELWYVYKEIDKNEKNPFDCDSWNRTNDLMDEIYDRLWRNVREWNVDWGTSKNDEKFGGDTMNSFATTFNALSGKDSYLKSFEDYREDKEKENSKYKILKNYAKYTGCLGNFILVPKGYNAYRGKSSKIKDYWDLSLYNLCYDKDRQGWLGNVGLSFDKYINIFFLWDYNIENKGKYCVKALFEGHEALLNPVNNVLPKIHGQKVTDKNKKDDREEYKDFKEFTEAANSCILRRGVFMAAMLEIEAIDHDKGVDKKKNDYKKIVNYLATDKCLGTMKDVINKLSNDLKEPISDKAMNILDKCTEELEKIDRIYGS